MAICAIDNTDEKEQTFKEQNFVYDDTGRMVQAVWEGEGARYRIDASGHVSVLAQVNEVVWAPPESSELTVRGVLVTRSLYGASDALMLRLQGRGTAFKREVPVRIGETHGELTEWEARFPLTGVAAKPRVKFWDARLIVPYVNGRERRPRLKIADDGSGRLAALCLPREAAEGVGVFPYMTKDGAFSVFDFTIDCYVEVKRTKDATSVRFMGKIPARAKELIGTPNELEFSAPHRKTQVIEFEPGKWVELPFRLWTLKRRSRETKYTCSLVVQAGQERVLIRLPLHTPYD